MEKFDDGIMFGIGLAIGLGFWGNALAVSVSAMLMVTSFFDVIDDEKVEAIVNRFFDLVDRIEIRINWVEIEGN